MTCLDAALFSEAGERDFYVYRGNRGMGSSLYEQNVAWVRDHWDELRHRGPAHLAESWFDRSSLERVERIQCRTLDEVLARLPRSFDFLKIDAQGAEQAILEGAAHFLRGSCLGLHLELFVLPLYRGIALLPEVVRFLDGFGFELVKRYPAHGTFESQHDCVFLKKDAPPKRLTPLRQVYRLA